MINKIFGFHNGTKESFIAAGYPETKTNPVIFIKGDENGNGSCIYANGQYFANVAEFVNALNFVKGVTVNGANYSAAKGGGYIKFVAADPAQISINAGSDGIEIGLKEEFLSGLDDMRESLISIEDDYLKKEDKTAIEQLISDLEEAVNEQFENLEINSIPNSVIDSICSK